VIEATSPHLSNGEFQELEEHTKYEDIFAEDSEAYGRTNRVYDRIDTVEAQPIPSPRKRLLLAKQAEVS
jgi:hypothetical protein